MKRFTKLFAALLLCLIMGITNLVLAQSNNRTVATMISTDSRFAAMNGILQQTDLENLFNGAGPYTLFVPTNAAFEALRLENPNTIRQIILYQTIIGTHHSEALAEKKYLSTALGETLLIDTAHEFAINDVANFVTVDIVAKNGVIHIIDTVIMPPSWGKLLPPVSQISDPPPSAAAADPPAYLNNPINNPAYVPGGHIPHWASIHADSHHCKGMTWTLLGQTDGVSWVGSDRRTNVYRGDTPCDKALPILCINQDGSLPPSPNHPKWAYGKIRLTTAIQGTQLETLDRVNQHCSEQFGGGWRMAEFHDAGKGQVSGQLSGWDFSALGNIPTGIRFWVHIDDQPANTFNSMNPRGGLPEVNTQLYPAVAGVGIDSAFEGEGERMPYLKAVNAGRMGCQGTTWVIHQQEDGLVKIGNDALTNPYHGDSLCDEVHPIACIRVDGYAPPPDSYGNQYSQGWSGGWVQLTPSVAGNMLKTRANANQLCAETFGNAWRMVEFHSGNLGQSGTDGNALWAYGSLPTGNRMWIAVSDQLANPWNQ